MNESPTEESALGRSVGSAVLLGQDFALNALRFLLWRVVNSSKASDAPKLDYLSAIIVSYVCAIDDPDETLIESLTDQLGDWIQTEKLNLDSFMVSSGDEHGSDWFRAFDSVLQVSKKRLKSGAYLIFKQFADVLTLGPTKEQREASLLWMAISEGEIGMVEDSLRAFPALAKKETHSGYPLNVAVTTQNCSIECVKLLLAAGADPNQATRIGKNTPFHSLACYRGHVENLEGIIEILVNAGGNINTPAQSGDTARQMAIISNSRRPEIVEAFVKFGADVKVRFRRGFGDDKSLLLFLVDRCGLDWVADFEAVRRITQVLVDAGADRSELKSWLEQRLFSEKEKAVKTNLQKLHQIVSA